MDQGLALGMKKAIARLGVLVTVGALAWGAVAAAGAASGCTTEPNPEYFEGGGLGACSGFYAKPIPASDCPGCSGGAFALCNGTSFNECVCDLPSDYSLDSGTFEASVVEITEGGLTSFDATMMGLPGCCKGKSVLEIPASNCPSPCAGPVGYAVCNGDAYNECACSIPPGYALSTATCDGG